VIVSDGRGGSRRYLRPKLWGVPPPPQGDRPVTTVRNLQSPFWIGTLRHAELRCLIPATAFAYWSGSEGAKRQHWFSVPSRPVFAFAGILRQGEDWPCFAIADHRRQPAGRASSAKGYADDRAPRGLCDMAGWANGAPRWRSRPPIPVS
jgi:hypothetical protein